MQRRKLLRTFFILLSVFFAISALVTFRLWQTGTLEDWARSYVINIYRAKIAPHLPFQIESVEVHEDWKSFRVGKIRSLSAVLKWGDWRVRISGPITIEEHRGLSIDYHAQTTLEPIKQPAYRSPPFLLDLALRLTGGELMQPSNIDLQLSADQWNWPLFQIESKAPKIKAHWARESSTPPQARFEIQADLMSWKKDESHIANLNKLNLKIKTPVEMKPIAIGPEVSVHAQAESSELLWGDTYLDLPLSEIPLSTRIHLDPHFQILDAHTKAPNIIVDADLKSRKRLQWKMEKLPIKKFLEAVIKSTQSSGGSLAKIGQLKLFQWKNGFLSSHGTLELPDSLDIENALKTLKGEAKAEQVAFQIPELGVVVNGATLDLPLSFNGTGRISANQLSYQNFIGRIDSTEIIVKPDKIRDHFRIEIHSAENSAVLPLSIDGIPFRIGAIQGEWADGKPHFKFSLSLDPTPLSDFAKRICIPGRIIPMMVSALVPSIDITDDQIDFKGGIHARLFDGTIDIDEMGIYDFLTEVPETDFNLKIEGIRMDELGDWLGFGEMNGVINADARDVVFQAALPTQFDFKIEAKPWTHSRIVFSPDAMKNFVKIFAGEEIDELPGIANWLAFGWPSRFFGGFDISYAGITVQSKDGTMLLRTLDPASYFMRERNHFILYGTRFKMQLKSSRYPLVLDSTAMSNFVHRIASQLSNLAREKAAKARLNAKSQVAEPEKEIENEVPGKCQPPEN